MSHSTQSAGSNVFMQLVRLVTLPYHRFFKYNTHQPALDIHDRISAIRSAASEAEARSQRVKLHHLILGWRNRKRSELDFVAVAGTVLAAVVTASFSWPSVQTAYWLAPAFWFISLSMSVCGILIAAQQINCLSIIGSLPDLPASDADATTRRAHDRAVSRHLDQILQNVGSKEPGSEQWILSWRCIFTWQTPMMFTGYSFLLYFFGLVLLIATPLIRNVQGEPWSTKSLVAVISLGGTALSWFLFALCSLAGYPDIKLPGNEAEDIVPKQLRGRGDVESGAKFIGQ